MLLVGKTVMLRVPDQFGLRVQMPPVVQRALGCYDRTIGNGTLGMVSRAAEETPEGPMCVVEFKGIGEVWVPVGWLADCEQH